MRPQRGNPKITQCGHAQPVTCKSHMPGCMHQMACNPLVGPLHILANSRAMALTCGLKKPK